MSDYLTKDLLNDIESKVYSLHKLYREKFGLSETSLRNVQVGDDLSNRIVYLNFPWESYENISIEKIFITIDENNFLCSRLNATSTGKYIAYKYLEHYNFLYYKYDDSTNNLYNYIRFRLPKDYGKVTSINESDSFFSCVKICDSKYQLQEYNKKVWVANEIPYLQYIDNIEEGINNVAKILFEPADYEYKEWTTRGYYGISDSDYGLAQKPISDSDFERWNRNIELLKDVINGNYIIWNVVSYINWNENSDYEWEDC